MSTHQFLFVRTPDLERSWPFLHEQMVTRLEALGVTTVLNTPYRSAPIHEQVPLADVIGISHYEWKKRPGRPGRRVPATKRTDSRRPVTGCAVEP